METTKILIEENSTQIEAIETKAKQNTAKLNAAYQVAPFRTFDELQKLVSDCAEFTRNEMRKDKLTRDLQDRGISVDVPSHLLMRTATLTAALDCFRFTRPANEGFEVDPVAVEAEANKFRRFVETPFQKRIWDRQEELIKTYNAFDFMGPNARMRNFQDNEFIKYDRPTGKWVRNKSALLHADEGDFKY